MKNSIAVKVYYIITGIIAVLSVFSWLGTLVSIANMDMLGTRAVQTVAVSAMALAGTYCISYIASLLITYLKKKMNFWSFLPLIHIVVWVIFLVLWLVME